MAAEAPPAAAGFNIDGDSFEFCGGSGVETVGEENQSLLGHIVKSLVRPPVVSRPRARIAARPYFCPHAALCSFSRSRVTEYFCLLFVHVLINTLHIL